VEEYAHIEFVDDTDNHTVQIPFIEKKTIDEKYIPDSIARVNDVATEFEEFAIEFDSMKMNATNPIGTGSFSLNRDENYPIGTKSIALGEGTIAYSPF
jgi:hypothetical protein